MTATADALPPRDEIAAPTEGRGNHLRVVRRRLTLLAVMALLPLALMGTLWLFDAVQKERNRLEDVASKVARDIVVQLDAEIRGHVRALQVLASLPAVDGDDLTTTQAALERALDSEPLWQNLFLLGPDGRQVVNADVPGALGRTPVPETVASIFATGRIAITDVGGDARIGNAAVAVQVPVRRGDEIRYVLSGVIEPADFAELLRTLLEPGWRAAVIDRKGRIVVRTSDGAARTGQLASEAARAAVARGEEGRLRDSSSLDGTEYTAFFLRSPMTGWSVHAAFPEDQLSPLQSSGISFVIGGALSSVLLAGLLGFLLQRDLQTEHRRNADLQVAQERARAALKEANTALEARVRERTDELQAILRQMPAGLIIAEAPSGRIVQANDLAKRILGRDAPHSVSLDEFSSDYHPHRADKTPFAADEIPLVRAIRWGEEVIDEEIRFPRGDGGWITVNASAAPIRDNDGNIRAGIVTITDVSRRKQLEDQQAFLVAELHHRVKNTLAIVMALAQQTWRATGDPATFFEALSGRLRALARVQDFILSNPDGKVDLRALLTAELGARGADTGEEVELRGPDVLLPGNLAQSLELIVYELATNAVKHGALNQPGGRLAIDWFVEAGELNLNWTETGVPIAAPPERHGFGIKLITTSLAAVGEASVEFAREGLRCRIKLAIA